MARNAAAQRGRRAAILKDRLATLPEPVSTVDVCLLAAATGGLTGTDLNGIIEDGKLAFAGDIVAGTPQRPILLPRCDRERPFQSPELLPHETRALPR